MFALDEAQTTQRAILTSNMFSVDGTEVQHRTVEKATLLGRRVQDEEIEDEAASAHT